MPSLATYNLTGDPYIDGLLGDYKWGVTSFTFSSPTSASYYEDNYGYGEPDDNFSALNGTQQSTVHATLEAYASFTGLEFTEITETSSQHADLRFAMSDMPSTAWAYFPSTAAEGGDAWFNNSKGYYDNPVKGNYAHSTFLHETGHALGLEHPHTDNVMPEDRDSLEYSVMSYRSYVGKSLTGGYTNETWGYPQSLMMYDIAALQHLYGPNFGTNSGNTSYSWSHSTGEMFIDGAAQGAPGGNRIFLTVWDGGGTDTYDFLNYTTDLNVDLRPGQWTTTSSSQLAKLHYDGSEVATGNIANALMFNGDQRSLIENAVGGSGDDAITGNAADNMLSGGDGDDTLAGGVGRDVLDGGTGLDTADYSSSSARVVLNLGTNYAYGGDATGDNLISIERAQGSAFDDRIAGTSGDNLLHGGDGDDQLLGGGSGDLLYGENGDDRLYGDTGNDTLVGGSGADYMVGGSGEDTFVLRTASDSLPSAKDMIKDFVSGVDTIDLQQIDANYNLSGDQAFSFIGGTLFGNTPGELNFRDEVVSGDTDGDGAADFQVLLAGVTSLTESDFIL